MPTYDFRCKACGKTVSMIMSFKEYDSKRPKCPKCGSRRLERLVTPFSTITSKKS
ncbi:MAG: zinc ribbon domain-containing protein [Nitrospinota bacterium]